MNYLKLLVEDIINIFRVVLCFFILYSLIVQSTVKAQSDAKNDSSKINTSFLADTSKFVMKKSAWGAVLRSAALPGSGQFYNESYWKIPLFWGVLGYFGYQWNSNNKFYKTYKDLYSNSLLMGGIEEYYKKREFYRDQRDMFAVFIGLTYFLNLVDAYVDAHLFDFDVETDIVSANYLVSLKIRF
jgi:hypothetical protein